eukprot:COSAG04_NODE_9774_length_834_cov_0.419048_1_plen_238_part_01
MVRELHQRYFVSVLQPHQKLVLVPGMYGPIGARGNDSAMAAADAANVDKLQAYWEYAKDPRIGGVAAWHWNDLETAFQPSSMTLGLQSFPRTLELCAKIVQELRGEPRETPTRAISRSLRVEGARAGSSPAAHLSIMSCYGLGSSAASAKAMAGWMNLALSVHGPNILETWEKQRIPALYGPLSGGSAELEVFTRKVGLNAEMPNWEEKLTNLVHAKVLPNLGPGKALRGVFLGDEIC